MRHPVGASIKNRTIIAFGGLLLLLPLIAASHWPLLDAPAHEARLAILHSIAFSENPTPFYEFDTLYLPNIAFDALGFILTFFVSPENAAKIFFALTVTVPSLTTSASTDPLTPTSLTNRSWHPRHQLPVACRTDVRIVTCAI